MFQIVDDLIDLHGSEDHVGKATGKDDSLVEYKEAEAFTTKIKTVDFSKAIRDLKHNPVVDPEEGIRRTTEWMRSFYRL
jgi:dTDP-glucose 4,6-dehydratase